MVRRLHRSLLFAFIALASLPLHADKPFVPTIPAGTQPGYGGYLGNGSVPWGAQSIAVNPVTDKVYVANFGSANVTVIDGSTMTAATVTVGNAPSGVAVNPVTNKIYVTNTADGSVSVIDGATNTVVATVTSVGYQPGPIAVNTLTNKVYVGSYGNSTVSNPAKLTIIDAQNGNAMTSDVYSNTAHVTAVAVNAATNKIYVGGTTPMVMIVDGATNAIVQVPAVSYPTNLLVDPATNKIFANSTNGGVVTVIDGQTSTSVNLNVQPSTPRAAIALNPLTGTIFSANNMAGTCSVFPETYASGPAPAATAGTTPFAVAVNPVTNKAYVVNNGSNNVTMIDGESIVYTLTVGVGTAPVAVAINPVTNKIYVANSGSNDVTVIDGSYSSTDYASTQPGRIHQVLTGIVAGTTPADIAVNPLTNQIYVANSGAGTVSIVDGTSSTQFPISSTAAYTSHTVTPVTVGTNPQAVAVNPVTNMIFVANKGSDSVSAINGAAPSTPTTVSLPTGAAPGAVAVNPVTNRIYVAETGLGKVAIIDGTNLAATPGQVTVGNQPSGGSPHGIAVDASTNRIYVANYTDNTINIIDGQSAVVVGSAIGVGTAPTAVAVNPATGKVYVTNFGSTFVSLVKTRSANSVTNITVNGGQTGIAIDGGAGKIYVTGGSSDLALIDSTSDTLIKITTAGGVFPKAIALDPAFGRSVMGDMTGIAGAPAVFDGAALMTAASQRFPAQYQVAVAANAITHKLYIAAQNADTSVFLPAGFNPNVAEVQLVPPPAGANPLTTTIAALNANKTRSATPTFTFNATSGFGPTPPDPNAVFFQVDSLQSQLLAATPTGMPGEFAGTTPSLPAGIHILYAFATDGRESADYTPYIGAIASYLFTVVPPTAPVAPTGVSAAAGNAQATVSFTPPADDGGSAIISYTVTSSPGGLTASAAASPITVTGLTNGTAYTFTVTATNAIGTSPPSAASNSVTPGVAPPAAPAFVAATASGTTTVSVSFGAVSGATSYAIYRSSKGGPFLLVGTSATAVSFPDSGLMQNTTYLYKVRALNAGGASPDSPIDPATTIVFTDASLAGMSVKAVHFLELRTAVDAMRASVGMPAVTYSHTIVAGLTMITAVDIQELRTGLDAARAALLVPAILYTDPTLIPGSTVIKAAHVTELRAGTQ